MIGARYIDFEVGLMGRPGEHPIMLLTRHGLVWNPKSVVGRIMPVVEYFKPLLGYGRSPAKAGRSEADEQKGAA